MELYKEILLHLCNTKNSQLYEDFQNQIAKHIESECYHALKKIKAIIEDDSLDDPECFMKIEQVVRVLESVGSNGGSRHDFS